MIPSTPAIYARRIISFATTRFPRPPICKEAFHAQECSHHTSDGCPRCRSTVHRLQMHQYIILSICFPRKVLTVVGSARHTPPALSVDVAHVLLQARVCHAASTVGDGAAGVLWAGSCHGEGGEGENGGDCELHFG
jgi:hypothetical protein